MQIQEQASDEVEIGNVTSIQTFIEQEVQKALNAKRITHELLRELDGRIATEVYLREKKDAILVDRKVTEQDDDTVSQLAKVQQEKLPVLENTLSEARSIRQSNLNKSQIDIQSIMSKTLDSASVAARSAS